MSEYVSVVDINELTEQDWNDIRGIALKMHARNNHQGDHMKIFINAFLEWLELNQNNDNLYDNEGKKFH